MKKMILNKKNIKYDAVVYILFAVFYLWMAGQIPYTHDDWDWGLDIGVKQWLTASINSRYVGNFFEVVMTRSEIMKTIIMGAGYFLLPLIITETVFGRTDHKFGKDMLIGFILCNVLILSMDVSIWQQTYGWVAGYANFGVSAISLCIILRQSLKVFDNIPSESTGFHPRSVFLFFVCLAGQLFIENVTIYIFLTSIFVNCIYWRRTKRFSCENISIFLAALIGLIIMFSSSIYQSLWSTGEAADGYRQLLINSETNIQTLITGCFQQIIKIPYKLYAQNTSVCTAIVILMSSLWIQNKQNGSLKKICIAVNGLIAACLLLCSLGGVVVASITGVLFFVAMTAELILLFQKEKLLLYKMLFIWASPICIILPLVLTGEMGPRLFFTSNAALVLFALFLFSFSLKTIPKKLFWSVIVSAFACVLLFHYGIVYHAIGECKVQRDAIIANSIQTEAECIVLPQYPYADYLWLPNPVDAGREQFFKNFYNIPENVTIVIDEEMHETFSNHILDNETTLESIVCLER